MFKEFAEKVRAKVEGEAKTKGYRLGDKSGKPGGELLDFVEGVAPGHPIGEILYKAVRYQGKKDPDDLLKIAAWAYLLWAKDQPMQVTFGGAPVPVNQYDPGQATKDLGFIAATEPARDYESILRVKLEMAAARKKHPHYTNSQILRLVACVAEESGEAMKEALDADKAGLTVDRAVRLRTELAQTAGMAIIVMAEAERRMGR